MRAFGIAWMGCFCVGFLLAACGEDASSGTDHGTGSSSGSGGATGGSTGTGAAGSGASASGGAPNVSFSVQKVTTWRNDATAAYTMFHDDTCNGAVDSQFSVAAPALSARGLVASFGAVAKDCEDRDLWAELETLREHGHEIVNHSYTHPNFNEEIDDGATVQDIIDEQIDQARAILEANLDGFVTTFFIFPEDAFDEPFLAHLEADGYLGARAGARGRNASDFSDDFRLKFDVYGPGYSIYTYEGAGAGTACDSAVEGQTGTGTDECRMYVLNHYVDETIAEGGYGIREMHGVGGPGNGWEPVPTALYEQHLDYVKGKVDAGDLWVTTASDAVRYRHARQACALPVVGGTGLTFGTPSADCSRYATALSYVISAAGASPTSLSATQAGADVDVRMESPGTFLVTADPSKGAVTLTPTF